MHPRFRYIYWLAFVPLFVVFYILVDWGSFLCDDAFISFRYARNFKDGHGLVFNVGEYVEGYSNFLWVLELGSLWKLFGLRPEYTSIWLSKLLTLGTIGLVGTLSLRSKISNGLLRTWMALCLLLSSATFAVWTTGGLETRQFTFLIVLAVFFLSMYKENERNLIFASLALGAAEYTRPEGMMLGGLAMFWYVCDAYYHKRLSKRTFFKM